jgi:UDP-glucuronate 4-epimerase
MKILLTGGAGFIGFHLAKALLERGDSIVIVDNFSDYYDPSLKQARIDTIQNNPNLKVERIDISNYKEIEEIFKQNKFDKVCHLAAQAGVRYSMENPFAYERDNVLGTLNMLELCKQFKVKDFVFASSSSVYGGNKEKASSEKDNVDTPFSIYAATKKANELYAHVYHKLYGLNCTGLRFFSVYGDYGRPDMAIFLFTKAISEGKPIDVFNKGDMKRDFTHVSDIVAGIVAAIDNPFPYEIFNLGLGKPEALMDFIEEIEKNLNKKATKNFLPLQKADPLSTYANIEKAKKMLNYNPQVTIQQGIKQFVEWYNKFYN